MHRVTIVESDNRLPLITRAKHKHTPGTNLTRNGTCAYSRTRQYFRHIARSLILSHTRNSVYYAIRDPGLYCVYHDEGSRGNNKNEIQVHGDDSRGHAIISANVSARCNQPPSDYSG